MRKIILASASPRRRELLKNAGIDFTVIPAQGEEKITSQEPGDAVQELAYGKAFSVAKALQCPEEGTLVIGADTVVVYENKILGKPDDEEDAVRTLKKLQGSTHQVYTGVSILVRKGSIWISRTFAECTEVEFYPVSEEEICAYVKTGEPMDKAGSYGIQGLWGIYVKGIRGDYNNVVGLPVAKLLQEIKKLKMELRG